MNNELVKKHLTPPKTIGVVGFSNDKLKASHTVPKYLTKFFNVIPINPNHNEISGLKCYPNLKEAEDNGNTFDIINIFRPSLDSLKVVEQAVSLKEKPKLIWLQSGIRNEEAKKIAKNKKIDFIQDECIYVIHKDFF